MGSMKLSFNEYRLLKIVLDRVEFLGELHFALCYRHVCVCVILCVCVYAAFVDLRKMV